MEAYDYVAVLERRKIGANFVNFLISAYHVDGESRRRNLCESMTKGNGFKCKRRSCERRPISFYKWQMKQLVVYVDGHFCQTKDRGRSSG